MIRILKTTEQIKHTVQKTNDQEVQPCTHGEGNHKAIQVLSEYTMLWWTIIEEAAMSPKIFREATEQFATLSNSIPKNMRIVVGPSHFVG